MDPREALILSLKREINVLLAENEHLRTALNVYSKANEAGPVFYIYRINLINLMCRQIFFCRG